MFQYGIKKKKSDLKHKIEGTLKVVYGLKKMSKNRVKTNLIHKRGKEVFEVSREKATGKYFIKGTAEEVPANKLTRKQQRSPRYDFTKPFIAQGLGDEWDDYPWGADDY